MILFMHLLSMQVFVEKCKYLEESKCVGVCINTCKLPTQVSMIESVFAILLLFTSSCKHPTSNLHI